MADKQGNGKVRLIAFGRYAESSYTGALRKMLLEKTIDETAFGTVMGRGAMPAEGDAGKVARAEKGRGDYYVEFDVTPDITESASATYMEEASIRGPASLMFYTGSPSRTFSISAKLVARNADEARKVIEQIHRLKSWRMPEAYHGGFMQKPPAVLLLQGYGSMFKDITVVMTDLTIEFSSEYDFISPDAGSAGSESEMSDEEYARLNGPEQPDKVADPNIKSIEGVTAVGEFTRKLSSTVPIIVPVSITLKEIHNPDILLELGDGDTFFDGLATFDILQYRNGELKGW